MTGRRLRYEAVCGSRGRSGAATSSRPVRRVQRSNATVANGGTDETNPTMVTHSDQRLLRATRSVEQDVGHEDPAVDRTEDLDAELARVGEVLDVHPDEEAGPREGLGHGDGAEQLDCGARVHRRRV